MGKRIKISAYSIFGSPIKGLKHSIVLDLELYANIRTLSCSEEEENGIYIFDIPDDIDIFAKVFVRLSSQVEIDIPFSLNHYKRVALCDRPHFLHPTCSQINLLAVMLDNSKAVPYTFNIQREADEAIGIIKAYKANKDGIFPHDTHALSYPNNEIYTIDLEQEIQLRAFIYEKQKTYMEKVVDETTQVEPPHKLQQGNVTKILDTEQSLQSNDNIRWAFKIVNGSYHSSDKKHTRGHSMPPLQTQFITASSINKEYKYTKTDITKTNLPQLIDERNGYYVVMNEKGLSINIKLKDLFSDDVLQSLVNKNIIFFAYNESDGIKKSTDSKINAYHVYSDTGKGSSRKVTKDRVTSIELK
ncbi:hypothetical protein CQA53_11540, partial [Helicobacter didelphidarum]